MKKGMIFLLASRIVCLFEVHEEDKLFLVGGAVAISLQRLTFFISLL